MAVEFVLCFGIFIGVVLAGLTLIPVYVIWLSSYRTLHTAYAVSMSQYINALMWIADSKYGLEFFMNDEDNDDDDDDDSQFKN